MRPRTVESQLSLVLQPPGHPASVLVPFKPDQSISPSTPNTTLPSLPVVADRAADLAAADRPIPVALALHLEWPQPPPPLAPK